MRDMSKPSRPIELFTLVCKERDLIVEIPNLTWQQALIEQSRKSWEYSDLLPLEIRDMDHIIPMLISTIRIVSQ